MRTAVEVVVCCLLALSAAASPGEASKGAGAWLQDETALLSHVQNLLKMIDLPDDKINATLDQHIDSALEVPLAWLAARPHVPAILEQCANSTECSFGDAITHVISQFQSFSPSSSRPSSDLSPDIQAASREAKELLRTALLGLRSLGSVVPTNQQPHVGAHGSRPAAPWYGQSSQVVSLLVGPSHRVIRGEDQLASRNTDSAVYFWTGFLSLLLAFDDPSGDATLQEDSFYLVFGEVFTTKIKRWRAIKAVYSSFDQWYAVFRNPQAGLQKWGGTSRVCLDWLPFMFHPYDDSMLVGDFMSETNFVDKMNIFVPNHRRPSVKLMRNVAETFKSHEEELHARLVEVKEHFMTNLPAATQRLSKVIDEMDGRGGIKDEHAWQFQLPQADLRQCWAIMETALETRGWIEAVPLSGGYLGLIRRYTKRFGSLVLFALGLTMLMRTFGTILDQPYRLCPIPQAPTTEGGLGLTDGQVICSNANREGSTCWLACGEGYRPNTNDDGKPLSMTTCQFNGGWSSAVSCVPFAKLDAQ